MGDHGTVLSQRVASGQVDLSRLSERWQLLEALYDAARAVIDNRSPDGICARMIDERLEAVALLLKRSQTRTTHHPGHEAARRHLAQRKDTNEASYRSDAEALHLPWPPANINIRDELGRLSHCAGLPDSDVLLRSVWRALSGHQHGRASAMLRGTPD